MTIIPFSDNSGSTAIGDLNVENGTSVVTISGDLELSRDKVGLKRALALKEVTDAIVEKLEAANDLPEKIEAPSAPTKQVPNPFS